MATSECALATVRFALFARLCAIAGGPGSPCSGWPGCAVDPALVVPLGTAAAAGAYWLSLVAGWPWLFPVLIAAC